MTKKQKRRLKKSLIKRNKQLCKHLWREHFVRVGILKDKGAV